MEDIENMYSPRRSTSGNVHSGSTNLLYLYLQDQPRLPEDIGDNPSKNEAVEFRARENREPQRGAFPSLVFTLQSLAQLHSVFLCVLIMTHNGLWLTYHQISRSHKPATTQLIELEFQNQKLVDLEDVLEHL
ncbi:hypothetical protein F5I97DRAFT_1404124 [Phlebopus sp. FC_14]|nr:hypothetical protein F5I97DRAFT_1404124 [Phlebopus sp. FC_14]